MARRKKTKYYENFEDVPLDEFMLRNVPLLKQCLAEIREVIKKNNEEKQKLDAVKNV